MIKSSWNSIDEFTNCILLQGVVRQMTINDLPVSRSVDETLRLIKAFQFVEKHGEGIHNTISNITLKLEIK